MANFKQQFLAEYLNRFLQTPIAGVRPQVQNQINSLANYLLSPIISPKELNLTYATIKYWESKGYLLLTLPKEAEEWRKYSIIEYLWFQLLITGQEMGCSIDKVAHPMLFAFANFKAVNDTIPFDSPSPPEIVIEGVRVNAFEGFFKAIIAISISRSLASLHISSNACQFALHRQLTQADAANLGINTLFKTGVTISLSDLVFALVLGKTSAQEAFKLFNDQETEVLKLLKQEGISEITIKQSEGKVYQIQSVEKMPVKNLQVALTSFMTGDYQDIQFKTNKNKTAYMERRTKKNI